MRDEDASEDEEIGFGACCKPRDLGLGIRSGFFQLKVALRGEMYSTY